MADGADSESAARRRPSPRPAAVPEAESRDEPEVSSASHRLGPAAWVVPSMQTVVSKADRAETADRTETADHAGMTEHVTVPEQPTSTGDVDAEPDVEPELHEPELREPALLVPPVRTSRRADRKTRRRRRTPVWAVLLIVVGGLLTVSGSGFALAVQSLINTVSNDVHQQDLLGNTVARTATGGVSIKGVINMLLVGIDTRDSNPTMGSRADSIIIVHIPASHDQAFLVSIPRDTNVRIPASPATGYYGSQDRINAAFEFGSAHGGGMAGGFQLLAKTIKGMYGISFQGGAIVNFDGFRDIVAKLGGVTMYVDEKTTSLHYGFVTGTHTVAAPYSTRDHGLHWTRVPGVTPMIYQVGRQHLTPVQALDFVRIRDFLPNGDYDRERHQQQFIKAVLEEAYHKGLQNPLRAGSFIKSISKAFVFSGGGVSVANWIFTLKSISPNSMLLLKVNNGTYNTLRVPRPGGGFDSREELSTKSQALMFDVAHDRVGQFVAANPTWVTS